MQKRAKNGSREAFIIENLYISKHIIPFIPSDIRWIRSKFLISLFYAPSFYAIRKYLPENIWKNAIFQYKMLNETFIDFFF